MRRLGWPEAVSAFLVGIGVGAAIGILFAPQSGEETRDYLIGTAQDKLDEANAPIVKPPKAPARKHSCLASVNGERLTV
jgi:hypothetical protein